jgi:hypothetical protein
MERHEEVEFIFKIKAFFAPTPMKKMDGSLVPLFERIAQDAIEGCKA